MNRIVACVIVLAAMAIPVSAWAQSNGGQGTAPSQDVSIDPATAGIAAVNAAADLLKSQGPDAGILYFNDALAQTRNAAVARAIRFELASLYAQAGRQDKALDTLKDQIASIPPTPAPSLVQLVPAENAGTTGGVPQQ